ncbi:unnamed protein product [Clonostachys rosea]|uniref:Serine carboxypeptidase S28 n=1 Tax=Bionectria ochroleuca TaxID=29856 RepID=A0ABY6TU74_BIOOC|nr:unnamed protein product [Clonostachys rosea]
MAISSLVKGIGLAFALASQQALAIYPANLHPFSHARSLRGRRAEINVLEKSQRQAYNLSVPVDHFHNETKYEPHSDDFFNLRYWVDDTYYKPGGPVILIGAGELTGVARLPYVEQGIGKILSQATGGLTVLLEHRYYGTSYPVPDLSTHNLRFLSTEQALADTSYFVRNIRYPGLEHLNLTSHTTPYIFYGGSYAGAFVALARKIYPDDFWGAISGSGVPLVIDDYWEYLEAVRIYGDQDCVQASQLITRIIDGVLLGDSPDAVHKLKEFFDLVELEDKDFAFFVNLGPMGLQETHWDPDIDGPGLARYCQAVTADRPLYSSTRTLTKDVKDVLAAAGFKDQADEIVPLFLNWIGHTRATFKEDFSGCDQSWAKCLLKGTSVDDISIPQGLERPWAYQTCTQWGYFLTGTGVPKDQSPLISRLIDYEYGSKVCPEGFGIPAAPDVESINRYGGANFSHSRVAFIDGEHDPWRQAGVHRIGVNQHRASTDSEPFILLEGGVHHWDQYGPKPNATGSWLPPKAVVEAQQEEIRFVKVWLREFAEEKARKEGAVSGSTDYTGLEL